MVLRDLLLCGDPLRSYTQILQLPHGERRLGPFVEYQRVAAAGEHDARVRVAARQLGTDRDALRRFVECHRAARGRHVWRDRAAQHDDAVGRPARGVPGRKTLFQRQYQCIAEWR